MEELILNEVSSMLIMEAPNFRADNKEELSSKCDCEDYSAGGCGCDDDQSDCCIEGIPCVIDK